MSDWQSMMDAARLACAAPFFVVRVMCDDAIDFLIGDIDRPLFDEWIHLDPDFEELIQIPED